MVQRVVKTYGADCIKNKTTMGNALETPSLDFHTMQRGADTHGVLDQATYQPILKTYLESLHILNTESATREIDFSCRNYKEILFRQRVLQYVWPQCVGIPMLSFQISSDYGVDWWIGVFKPLLDIMFEQMCQLDRETWKLLGGIEQGWPVAKHSARQGEKPECSERATPKEASPSVTDIRPSRRCYLN